MHLPKFIDSLHPTTLIFGDLELDDSVAIRALMQCIPDNIHILYHQNSDKDDAILKPKKLRMFNQLCNTPPLAQLSDFKNLIDEHEGRVNLFLLSPPGSMIELLEQCNLDHLKNMNLVMYSGGYNVKPFANDKHFAWLTHFAERTLVISNYNVWPETHQHMKSTAKIPSIKTFIESAHPTAKLISDLQTHFNQKPVHPDKMLTLTRELAPQYNERIEVLFDDYEQDINTYYQKLADVLTEIQAHLIKTQPKQAGRHYLRDGVFLGIAKNYKTSAPTADMLVGFAFTHPNYFVLEKRTWQQRQRDIIDASPESGNSNLVYSVCLNPSTDIEEVCEAFTQHILQHIQH